MRVASCLYYASYELLVAFIVRVTSCELHLLCELRGMEAFYIALYCLHFRLILLVDPYSNVKDQG